MMNKITMAVRIFMGLVFMYASFDKILHPGAFAEAVYNYQLLPGIFVNIVALVLPWLELAVGACLVLGLFQAGAIFTINALLIFFMSALAFNMARGLNIHCGCFSTRVETLEGASMAWTILRDAGFLACALFLLFRLWKMESANQVRTV